MCSPRWSGSRHAFGGGLRATCSPQTTHLRRRTQLGMRVDRRACRKRYLARMRFSHAMLALEARRRLGGRWHAFMAQSDWIRQAVGRSSDHSRTFGYHM